METLLLKRANLLVATRGPSGKSRPTAERPNDSLLSYDSPRVATRGPSGKSRATAERLTGQRIKVVRAFTAVVKF